MSIIPLEASVDVGQHVKDSRLPPEVGLDVFGYMKHLGTLLHYETIRAVWYVQRLFISSRQSFDSKINDTSSPLGSCLFPVPIVWGSL